MVFFWTPWIWPTDCWQQSLIHFFSSFVPDSYKQFPFVSINKRISFFHEKSNKFLFKQYKYHVKGTVHSTWTFFWKMYLFSASQPLLVSLALISTKCTYLVRVKKSAWKVPLSKFVCVNYHFTAQNWCRFSNIFPPVQETVLEHQIRSGLIFFFVTLAKKICMASTHAVFPQIENVLCISQMIWKTSYKPFKKLTHWQNLLVLYRLCQK